MDGTIVYSKTPRGIAEISLRQAQLPMTARRVLIMIDGKRTVEELLILGKQLEIENAIVSLESGGLIQRVAYQNAIDVPTINGRDTDAGLSTAFGGPSTSGSGDDRDNPITLEEVKRRAIRGLNDRLGSEADLLAGRIDACHTIEEFRGCVREAERLISNAQGSAAAQDYLKALRRRG
ncbi:MAG TPA: hypothetical protein VNA44_01370 [Burkholderiaceae bacterium]|nr:hypothetical protein [Burkholderiaceae bacterium]